MRKVAFAKSSAANIALTDHLHSFLTNLLENTEKKLLKKSE